MESLLNSGFFSNFFFILSIQAALIYTQKCNQAITNKEWMTSRLNQQNSVLLHKQPHKLKQRPWEWW